MFTLFLLCFLFFLIVFLFVVCFCWALGGFSEKSFCPKTNSNQYLGQVVEAFQVCLGSELYKKLFKKQTEESAVFFLPKRFEVMLRWCCPAWWVQGSVEVLFGDGDVQSRCGVVTWCLDMFWGFPVVLPEKPRLKRWGPFKVLCFYMVLFEWISWFQSEFITHVVFSSCFYFQYECVILSSDEQCVLVSCCLQEDPSSSTVSPVKILKVWHPAQHDCRASAV